MDALIEVCREGIRIGVRRYSASTVSGGVGHLLNYQGLVNELSFVVLSEEWQKLVPYLRHGYEKIRASKPKDFGYVRLWLDHFMRGGGDRSAYALSILTSVPTSNVLLGLKFRNDQLKYAKGLLAASKQKSGAAKIQRGITQYIKKQKYSDQEDRLFVADYLCQLLPEYSGRDVSLIIAGIVLFATEPSIECPAPAHSQIVHWEPKAIDWNFCTPRTVPKELLQKCSKKLGISVIELSSLWLLSYIERLIKAEETPSFWYAEYLKLLDKQLTNVDKKALFSRMVVVLQNEINAWLHPDESL